MVHLRVVLGVIVGKDSKNLEKEEFVGKTSRGAFHKGQFPEKWASTIIRLKYSIIGVFIQQNTH